MYLSIDIGGTKTLLALFSSKGRVMKRLKFPTAQNPEKFAKDLQKNLNIFFPKSSLRTPTLDAVVTAIAGPVNSNYSVRVHSTAKLLPTTFGKPLKYGNLPWKGFKFTETIEACIKNLFKSNRVKLSLLAPKLSVLGSTTECCPIYIGNDANLAAFYEGRNKKGKCVYLTFSTGIGGGITFDGSLSSDSDAFEPGHRKYIWQSKPLEYEDIASANALKAVYGVQATDIKGRAAFQDIALRMSTGLADIIREERPDHIIIGGALGLRLRYFKRDLLPILATSLHCSVDELPAITAAEFPLESVIHGCYLYGSKRH